MAHILHVVVYHQYTDIHKDFCHEYIEIEANH